MINSVTGQPALAVETVGPLFHELPFAAGTFGYIIAVEPDQVAILRTAMGTVARVAGCPAPLEIEISGDVARMKGETLVPQDA